MAHVAMCDNCEYIFSLNVDGWEEFTRERRTMDARNGGAPVIHERQTIHMCPNCATGGGLGKGAPKIRVELPSAGE